MSFSFKEAVTNISFCAVANIYFKFALVTIYGFVSSLTITPSKFDSVIFYSMIFILAIFNIGFIIYLAIRKTKANKNFIFISSPLYSVTAIVIAPMYYSSAVSINIQTIVTLAIMFFTIPFAGLILNYVFNSKRQGN